jgi:hypothetical protein
VVLWVRVVAIPNVGVEIPITRTQYLKSVTYPVIYDFPVHIYFNGNLFQTTEYIQMSLELHNTYSLSHVGNAHITALFRALRFAHAIAHAHHWNFCRDYISKMQRSAHSTGDKASLLFNQSRINSFRSECNLFVQCSVKLTKIHK